MGINAIYIKTMEKKTYSWDSHCYLEDCSKEYKFLKIIKFYEPVILELYDI